MAHTPTLPPPLRHTIQAVIDDTLYQQLRGLRVRAAADRGMILSLSAVIRELLQTHPVLLHPQPEKEQTP